MGSHCQDFERSSDGVEPAPGKGGFQGSLDGTGETSTRVKVRDGEGVSPGARAQPAGWSLGTAEPERAEPQGTPPRCLRRGG